MKHEWEYKKLGEVAPIICGKDYKSVLQENGQYPIYGSGGIMGYASEYRCPENCTIVGRKGSINNPLFVTTKFWNVDTAFGLNPKLDYINPKYLYYFCTNFDFNTLNVAVTLPSLRRTDVENISINLPPLPTQQSIVSELDSLSKIIADCKETLKDYDALEQSIFYDMFGDPVKNEKGWDVKIWSDVFDTKLGKMLDKAKQSEIDQQYPYLANFNVQWRTFDLTDLRTMAFSENELTKYSLQEGDLMICEGGESGRCAVWHDLGQTILFQKAIHRARLKCSLDANVEYVSFLMQILKLGNGLKDFISQSTIEHLTGEKLNKLPIPLPPLNLQQQFADKIAAIEQMKSETKKALQEAETLFNARMDYWFN